MNGSTVGDGQLFTWKAMLQPHANGGNVSISATCTGCANTTAATISDVTFGDVWVCRYGAESLVCDIVTE